MVPPSTKARWQLKLNILLTLSRLYPVSIVSIEDVNTELKKGEKRRNGNFSPVMAGKNYLYNSLKELGYEVVIYRGKETATERNRLGLYKSKDKLSNDFSAHCVDSWTLANLALGVSHTHPEMKEVIVLKPIPVVKRQLHKFNPQKGGRRSRYGGTVSEGYKKGTLVIHPKFSKTYIGGNDGKGRVSLHDYTTGKRLTQLAKLGDCKVIAHSPWIVNYANPKVSKELRVIYSKQKLSAKLALHGIPNSRIFLELKQPVTKVT